MKNIIQLLSVIACSTTLLSATGPANRSPELIETILDLRIISTVLAEYEEEHDLPASTSEFQPLAEFANRLNSVYRERLPLVDGWGRPILMRITTANIVVLSTGANARIDDSENLDLLMKQSTGIKHHLQSLKGDDLIALDRAILKRPLGDERRQLATMADMRSIAVAVEEHAIDNNAYPGPTNGFEPIKFLESYVEPVYIRRLPRLDGWGTLFLYWSNEEQYAIVSLGSDAAADREYVDGIFPESFLCAFTEATGDIVLANGALVRWPHATGAE